MDLAKGGRKVSLIFFAAGIVLTALSLAVGISDNPTGIFLLYTGITLLMLGFVHRWRSVKRFLMLTGISLAGFVLFAVAHNGMYAFGVMTADIAVLRQILGIFGGIFFLIAVILCPVGILVGGVGSIITLISGKLSKSEV